ncbi:MAG TPA: thioredoxin domain-containing protein, partial [Ktedonobacterales bacterium]
MTDTHEHTNRLIHELSPYLQQHAHNPVDWYPWGPEALAKAAAEDKPIFLSIGYSACHWCHRLREESFEDASIARLMSEHFISIKVDREERPDLDALYMEAVQQLTGSGGWPMSVFLTPTGAPFAGGTYFPPEPRYQMPSFRQVLLAIAEAWRTRREEIERQAAELAGALSQTARSGLRKPENFLPQTARVPVATLAQATEALLDRMDPVLGGFGPAPKFPQPMTLDFLLRMQARRASPRG